MPTNYRALPAAVAIYRRCNKLKDQKVSLSLATLCIELFLQHQQLRTAPTHGLAVRLPEAHKVHAMDVCWRAIPLQGFCCLW